MKTTYLFLALSSLAMAEQLTIDPAVDVQIEKLLLEASPEIRVSGGGGFAQIDADQAKEILIRTAKAGALAEPLKWNYTEGRGSNNEVVREGPVGFLGVVTDILPEELSAHLSLPEDTGLLVQVVSKGSPAEKAGLQASDVVAKFDDQILVNQFQLSVLVANKKEGDTAKITYIRKGETHEANVVMGKREGRQTEVGKVDADLLFKRTDGAPLRTFVRRFEIPGGKGSVEITEGGADISVIEEAAAAGASASGSVPDPSNNDVRKQLDEIRAMLEALQQKVK